MALDRDFQREAMATSSGPCCVLGEGREEVEETKPGREGDWQRVAAWVGQARVRDCCRHHRVGRMLHEHENGAPSTTPRRPGAPDQTEGYIRVDVAMVAQVSEQGGVRRIFCHSRKLKVFRSKEALHRE